MAHVLENTLRRAVIVTVGGKNKQIPARGRLVVETLPSSLPRGVITRLAPSQPPVAGAITAQVTSAVQLGAEKSAASPEQPEAPPSPTPPKKSKGAPKMTAFAAKASETTEAAEKVQE